MGIDYGTRRIGVAISDPGCTMALPFQIIDVKADGSHIKNILKTIKDYNITKIVVGLPYNMDGSIGDSGKKVIEWTEQLKEILNIPIILWDERLTTFEAHDILKGNNVKGIKRKNIVDKIAASLILKDYLNTIGT